MTALTTWLDYWILTWNLWVLGLAVLVPLLAWGRMHGRRHPRVWLALQITMAFTLGLWPLWTYVVHAFLAWIHRGAAPRVLLGLMPGRRAFPLDHYAVQVDRLLLYSMAGLVLLFLVVFGMLAAREGIWAESCRDLRRLAYRPVTGLVLVLELVLLVPALGKTGLDLAFRFAPHPVFYTDCRKLWGHRGHPEPPRILEDTLPSFRRAFDLGAPGVEMDVAYDPDRDLFYIHRSDNPAIPPTPLETIFAALHNRGYFWVDLKTLHDAPPDVAKQAAQSMRRLLERYDLLDRVIVETDNPHNLRIMAHAGLHTSFWIFNMDEDQVPKAPFAYWWLVYTYKWHYVRGGFSAISLDRRFYTPTLAWALEGARIHLFTVDNMQDLRYLVRLPQVRVILTNTARYDISACP